MTGIKILQESLLARFQQKQIDALYRVESIADASDRVVNRWGRDLIELLKAGILTRDNVELTLSTMLRDVVQVMQKGFENTARWSWDQTIGVYAKTIPRRWVRLINPVSVYAGESYTSEDVDLSLLDYDTPTEPIVGRRLTDEEWEKFCKKNVFEPPSANDVATIVASPINNVVWTQRIQNLSKLVTDFQGLETDLVQRYSQGAPLKELSLMTETYTQGIKSSARRIARTEGLRVANKIQRNTYDQLADLYAGVQIVATLDQNTRPHHALRNGRVYYKDFNKAPDISELPELPDEPNCRCFDIPFLIPPKGLETDKDLQLDFQNATGQMIPDPVVYSQWFDNAGIDKRKLAVGARRYEVAKKILNREPEWRDFIDQFGRLIKIDRLKKEKQADRDQRRNDVEQIMTQRRNLLRQISTYGFISKFRPVSPPKQKKLENFDYLESLFGKESPKYKIRNHSPEVDYDTSVKKIFGKLVSIEDLSMAAGAPDGSTVTIDIDDIENEISIRWNKSGTAAGTRRFLKDSEGRIVCYNSLFSLSDLIPKGEGIGTEIFARQVYNCKKINVQELQCYGAGNPKEKEFNGYYTWARLGYDGETENAFSDNDDFWSNSKWKDTKKVSEIVQTEEGRKAWKEYGSETDYTFSLDDNSYSMNILISYYKEKKGKR